ncbi:MAG: hypothetical protein AAGD33_06515 [Actinomycetota bacterium]
MSHPLRRLGGALEPVIGQIYFAPEAHAEYEQLGFAESSGTFNGVAGPDGPAYFTSRGSVMGQVSGGVVASAFAVFDPRVVVPCVDHGWSLTDAPTICAARDRGALGQLTRLLGERPDGLDRCVDLLRRATSPLTPEGRPLYAGLALLDPPDHPLGELWRLGDRLREFRGDGHTLAWVGAGLDACEIGLLTELFWGLPLRSYTRTRGWSDERFDRATASLESRGLVADGAFTDAGRSLREGIESTTDALCAPIADALGHDDIDELCSILEPWGATVRAGHGYPAAGPHDLADRVSRST